MIYKISQQNLLKQETNKQQSVTLKAVAFNITYHIYPTSQMQSRCQPYSINTSYYWEYFNIVTIGDGNHPAFMKRLFKHG